jgi:3-oxoadipate enol-lactonase
VDLPWYEVSGSGPPVVLLHEGIADSRMWVHQLPALEPEFTVVRIDQRGFGRSPLPPGRLSRVEDVVSVLDELGLERAAVVGASFGGRVALELAGAHPERVERLVLVAPGLGGHDWSEEVRRFNDEEEAAYEAGDLDRATDLNVRLWVDGPRRGPDAVPSEVREQVRTMQREAFELPEPDPLPESVWPEPPVDGRLGELATPTLVVVGDEDVPDMLEIAGRLAAEIPGARKAIFPDTAHMLPLERPEEFNRILLDFLHTGSG